MAVVSTSDLAKKLGLTRVTVSRAINDDPRVAEKTRRKVKQAMQDYCLEPNAIARALVRGRTLTIGLAVGDLRGDYLHELMSGLEPEFEKEKFSILIGVSSFNSARERIELSSMLARRVEGIISQPLVENQEYYLRLQHSQTPVVFFADYLDLPGASWVVSDVAHDVRMAIEHLLSIGHRRIAFVGPKSKSLQHIPRFRIYRQVLKEAGISVPESYIYAGIEGGCEDVYKAVHEMMNQPNPPTAFLGAVDVIAIYIIDQLRRDGYRVPEDVSVMGVGNLASGRYDMISLTTIDEDREQMGRTAARIMLDLIQDKNQPPRQIFMPGSLILRQTTASPK
jgi:LacI family transcriptional regulator